MLNHLKSLVKSWALLARLARWLQSKVVWLRWYLRRPALPDSAEKRLHLGCGDIDVPGFINIDGRPMPHVHFVQPLNDLQNFESGSVGLVYASHCLEHFPHNSVLPVLREWHRVIKPGGVLRLSVPDFDALIEVYLREARDLNSIQTALMGGQDYQFNFHYVMLNEKLLTELLFDAGFNNVRRWQWGAADSSSLPDWSGRNVIHRGREYFISLNIEGLKA